MWVGDCSLSAIAGIVQQNVPVVDTNNATIVMPDIFLFILLLGPLGEAIPPIATALVDVNGENII